MSAQPAERSVTLTGGASAPWHSGQRWLPLQGRCHAWLPSSRGVPGEDRQPGQQRLCCCSERLSAVCDKDLPRPPASGRQRGGPEVAAEGDARISSLHARVVTGSARFARHLWWHGDSCGTQTPTPHSWARVLTPPQHQGGHEAAAPPSHEPGCCGVSPGCCSQPLGTDRLLPRAGKQRGAFAPRARGGAAGSGAKLRQCPGGSRTRVPARPRGCPSSCAGAALPCSGAATRLCRCGRLRASHAVSSSIQPLSHANDCQHETEAVKGKKITP